MSDVLRVTVESVRGKHDPQGVYVGRGVPNRFPNSPLANPFRVGPDCDRLTAIARFRSEFEYQLTHGGPMRDEFLALKRTLEEKGALTLLCWCAPAPCHADVIREYLLTSDVGVGREIEEI